MALRTTRNTAPELTPPAPPVPCVSEIRRVSSDVGVTSPRVASKHYRFGVSSIVSDCTKVPIATLSAGAANPTRQVVHSGGASQSAAFDRIVVLP